MSDEEITTVGGYTTWDFERKVNDLLKAGAWRVSSTRVRNVEKTMAQNPFNSVAYYEAIMVRENVKSNIYKTKLKSVLLFIQMYWNGRSRNKATPLQAN